MMAAGMTVLLERRVVEIYLRQRGLRLEANLVSEVSRAAVPVEVPMVFTVCSLFCLNWCQKWEETKC